MISQDPCLRRVAVPLFEGETVGELHRRPIEAQLSEHDPPVVGQVPPVVGQVIR